MTNQDENDCVELVINKKRYVNKKRVRNNEK